MQKKVAHDFRYNPRTLCLIFHYWNIRYSIGRVYKHRFILTSKCGTVAGYDAGSLGEWFLMFRRIIQQLDWFCHNCMCEILRAFCLFFAIHEGSWKALRNHYLGAVKELKLPDLLNCAYILYLVFSRSLWMPSFQIFVYLPSSVSYYLVLYNPCSWNTIVETPKNWSGSNFSVVIMCKYPVVKCHPSAQLPVLHL